MVNMGKPSISTLAGMLKNSPSSLVGETDADIPIVRKAVNPKQVRPVVEKPVQSKPADKKPMDLKFDERKANQIIRKSFAAETQESIISQERLQEAIIWSEIIGEPLCKRRKRR